VAHVSAARSINRGVPHVSRFSRRGAFHPRTPEVVFVFVTNPWCPCSLRTFALDPTISPVPWGLKRYYGAGDLHFITCSCYRRQPLLGTAKARDSFLQVLEIIRQRYQFVVVGYVIMPEHSHLLISEPQEHTPSTVMQALKLSYARQYWRQRNGDKIRFRGVCSATSRSAFGRPASMISMCGVRANGRKNSVTCITTQ
jgi:REP element-mobilizing transposase RayT